MKQTTSLFPDSLRCLSGSMLKVIAMVTMLLDHVAAHLLSGSKVVLFSLMGKDILLYAFLRAIGRLAFPIYVFLLVEGFRNTKSRFRYGRNLLLFALISEIPWNLEHSGTIFYSSQNVFFTLFFGFLGLCLLERQLDTKGIVGLIALAVTAMFFRADYGIGGFCLILLMYMLREYPVMQFISICGVLSSRWKAGLAFIPISLYNGKRGFIHGRLGKYLCYAFYPVHILIIAFLKYRH